MGRGGGGRGEGALLGALGSLEGLRLQGECEVGEEGAGGAGATPRMDGARQASWHRGDRSAGGQRAAATQGRAPQEAGRRRRGPRGHHIRLRSWRAGKG